MEKDLSRKSAPLRTEMPIYMVFSWLFSGFPSRKVARRARSALQATFLLFYAPQRAISLIIHEKDAKFFTFFRFPWHLEDGFGTILFRISQRTIPLKISRHENQGKWLKKASEGEAWCRLSYKPKWHYFVQFFLNLDLTQRIKTRWPCFEDIA